MPEDKAQHLIGLKFTNNYTHPSDGFYKYTFDRYEHDHIIITWLESDGTIGESKSYTVDNCLRNVERGNWTVEESKNVLPIFWL